ncbi:K02A2.6-like [Cordylochernes scorpioides]|uniref:RNA-directed DNA polymerase n=1 Tax=Cordylochernes scorpioides TaxID=51811 RepID=A0ABY6LMS2_9ARAC|nr:K02A2.6-like [Cordylochernes scorpioides]
MSNIPLPAPILINSQAAENWRFFKSQWDNYQVATELNKKDNNVIRATFLSLIGKYCFNVFLNLDLKEDEKNSLPKIIEALDNHFTPQKNVIYERYIFNTSNQEENEGIDSYTNRLRGLASSCEYDILTEELIRDRIVLGIKDNRVRKKLLMEPKLNLSSVIDICRTAEVTEQQITKLTGQESEDVKWNRKYERKKEATKATNETFEDIINCHYCGSKHRKASCPAYANQTVPLECQLDSGSTCNIMSLDDYRWVMQERSNNLDVSNARLENLGGVILKPVVQKYLDCYFEEKKYNLLFQIVNINQKPLLSAKTIEDLNLVTKHDAVYHLANSSCSRAESIINKYEDVFKGLGMLPKEYHIEIEKEAKPVQQHPRRIPIGLKAEFKRKLDDLEGRGIIGRVQKSSSWISNLVLVRKQNKLRVCLDPRDLNKVIKRPHFQIPTIDEILPSLNNAKIFTVIDAKDGFWQVKLDSQSSDLTTFWTPFGRRLHEVIEGLEGVEVIADDILVFGKGNTTEDAIRDHNLKLEQLLMRARKRNLKYNKDKIRLCSNHVNYMRHILSDEGLKPDPGKVEAIKAMSRPQNVREIQQYLGCINYLTKFLPRLSEVVQPLRVLTQKCMSWSWSEPQEQAFILSKELVTQAPVLKYFDPSLPVTIQSDASDKGLGAVLLQEEQPVAYASKALTNTETRYAQIEKECLSIVFACEHFYQYIAGGTKVHIETDQKPLENIFKMYIHQVPKRLQRMLLRLQRYNLEVKYKPGKQMYISDCLSRKYLMKTGDRNELNFEVYLNDDKSIYQEIENIKLIEFVNISTETAEQIRQQNCKDQTMQVLVNLIRKGWPKSKYKVPREAMEYWKFRDELTEQDGMIYKGQKVIYIIPKTLRSELLNRVHASHHGVAASLAKARQAIFWPGMNQSIKETVEKCKACLAYQPNQTKETIMCHETPILPWNKIGMDIFKVETTQYLITVDYYSSFWELDILEHTTSESIIECCKKNFSRHGIPETLITDNGPQFISREFQKFLKTWKVVQITSSPYHSQSNGKAESAVKSAKMLQEDLWLAILEWRNTPLKDLGFSPNQALISRRTQTLIPIHKNLLKPEVQLNARDLTKLNPGQSISVKLKEKDKWRMGKCISAQDPRSYIVEVDGHEYRRNRRDIRTLPSGLNLNEEYTDQNPQGEDFEPNENKVDPICESSTSMETPRSTDSGPRRTRSGRPIRTPSRYSD